MRKFFQILAKTIKNERVIITILLITGLLIGASAFYLKKTEVLPESAAHFLDDVRIPENGQKLLVFSPHPDDETLGAGGYITESIQKKAIVKIVLVTDGNKHHLKEQRYDEFKKATSKLGVPADNLVYLNYPDGSLSNTNQDKVRESLKKEIDEFSPDIIVCSDSKDTHPDHADVGRLIETITKEKGNKILTYQYLIHSKRYPQPKSYVPSAYLLPPVSLVNFDKEWKRYMLSNNEEKIKEDAVNTYKSQLKVPILRSTMLSLIRRNELFEVLF